MNEEQLKEYYELVKKGSGIDGIGGGTGLSQEDLGQIWLEVEILEDIAKDRYVNFSDWNLIIKSLDEKDQKRYIELLRQLRHNS